MFLMKMELSVLIHHERVWCCGFRLICSLSVQYLIVGEGGERKEPSRLPLLNA